MKKVALVFVLAVFVPSLVLAWLAVRSLRDQQIVLERQQSLLYQGVADSIAKQAQDAFAREESVAENQFYERAARVICALKNLPDLLRRIHDIRRSVRRFVTNNVAVARRKIR